MPKKTYAKPPGPREQEVIDNADYYVVYCKRDVCDIVKVENLRLSEARELAGALANRIKKHVLIYAVYGTRQAYLETIKPSVRGTKC